jgi:hypothetical protein
MFTFFLQVTAREFEPQCIASSKVYSHTCIRLAELSEKLIASTLVGIATRYWLDEKGVGVRVPVGSRIFSSPCPDRLWDPPNLLSNGYWGLVPWG